MGKRGKALPARCDLIERFIQENPGCTFAQIKRDAGVPNGVLVYHLQRLQKQGRIVRHRDGARVRFAPGRHDAPLPPVLTLHARRILHALEAMPGATQAALRERLGLSRSTVSFYVRRLIALGAIVDERRDGAKRYRLRGEGSANASTPNRAGTAEREAEARRDAHLNSSGSADSKTCSRKGMMPPALTLPRVLVVDGSEAERAIPSRLGSPEFFRATSMQSAHGGL